MVSEKEAAKRYKEQQKKNKERQRKLAQRRKEKGQKRITCVIEGDAYEILESLSDGFKRTFGDVVTDALRAYNQENEEEVTEIKLVDDNKADRDSALEYICKLKDEGYTAQQIADLLNEGEIPTISGRGVWRTGTIAKMWKECD